VSGPVVELLGPAVGGIRTHVAELTRLRRARGHDTIVAGPLGALGPSGTVDEVVDVPRRNRPLAVLRARRQLRDLLARSGATVVHAHGLKAGWVAVSVRPRPRVVLTVHNIVLDPTAGLGHRVLAALEGRLAPLVDHVISPSAAIDRRLAPMVPAERRSIILPVSPLAQPRRGRAEVRRDLGIDEGAPLVVVVARLHRQKDLPTFVAAFASVVEQVPDAQAVVVGDGVLRAELTAAVESGGRGGRRHHKGARDHAVDQIGAADVLAVSSVWEAVPLVVVEALLLAVPVVTTRVGIVEELIEHGVGGEVVDVGDAAGMARALVALLRDPEARHRVGDAGRARAEARVDPEALVDAVETVYERLETRTRT
jgi:glycosyltransferase involved in cell wall biosynthesis